MTMTGAPSKRYPHDSNTDKNELWDKLVAHDQAKDIMTLGSHSGSDSDTSAAGIYQGHAYTLLSTHMVAGNKLLKVRNPHGREAYVGPWSDEDARWTPELL